MILRTPLSHTLQTHIIGSPLGKLQLSYSIFHEKFWVHALDYLHNQRKAHTTKHTSPQTDSNAYSGVKASTEDDMIAFAVHPVMRAFRAYFSGDLNALSKLPVKLHTGTPFQQAVWLALRHIPAGKTASYKQLAIEIGKPNSARAVGQALRKNPLPIILPCHRVIKSSGKLGGYAGSSDVGNMRKRHLLWHEGQLETEPLELI